MRRPPGAGDAVTPLGEGIPERVPIVNSMRSWVSLCVVVLRRRRGRSRRRDRRGGRIAAAVRPDCPIFPATNVWNKRVDSLPVAANSADMIKAIGPNTGLHPDFGSYLGYGIPYNVVTSATHKVSVTLPVLRGVQPRPLPDSGHPRIEAGSDHHLLIVDKSTCTAV